MIAAVAVVAMLGATTMAIALLDPAPASLLRHLYLLPIATAAFRFGVIGGALTGGAGVMLYAPFVVPELERRGLGVGAGDGLVTLATLGVVGPLAGVLVTYGRRQRARYETLRAVQRTLADDAPLPAALRRLHACLAQRLGADELRLVVSDGDQLVCEGGGVALDAVAARVLEAGAPVFVGDVGDAPRPHRVLAVPLATGDATIGALVVARFGELGGDEQTAIVTLGAQLGIALENARLASRQRRFAEELAAKVAAATERLEELSAAKTAFVAIAAHELRTPLTALRGFSELLATREFEAAEVRRIARILEREIDRLSRIVNDFLDLSRVEQGLAPALCRAPLALAPALARVADVFRRQRATCSIAVECADPLPSVDADADAVDRILVNLVSNAVKYASADGSVRLRAWATDDGGAVVVVIEDDGRGIPPDALAHVFEPYYRAPDAASTIGGTGIGLAIVRALVEAHGGVIDVASEPARGTRVTFTLPTVMTPAVP